MTADDDDAATVKENTMMKMNQAEQIVMYFWDIEKIKKVWKKLEPGYVERHVYYIPIGTEYEVPDTTEGDDKKDEDEKAEEVEEVEEVEEDDEDDEEDKAEEVKSGTENKEKKKVFATEFTEQDIKYKENTLKRKEKLAVVTKFTS